MNRKIITLFTLVAFIIFSLSCHSIKKKRIETVARKGEKTIAIYGIVKTSGEIVKFPKVRLGRIHKETILVWPIKSKRIEINRADAESIIREEGDITRITTKDGEAHYGFVIREEEDKIVLNTYELIPFSEIKQVLVKKFDPIKPLLVVLGLVGVAYLGLVLIFSGATWD